MGSCVTNSETSENVFKKGAADDDDDDDDLRVGSDMSLKRPHVDRCALTSSLFCKILSCPE